MNMLDFGYFVGMVWYLLVSFGFFVGILLMTAPDAFHSLNKAMQAEYGVKIRFFPKLEGQQIKSIDQMVHKNMAISGMMISTTAFVLLMIYK